MAPVFATNMGLAFDHRDLIGRSHAPAADRDRQGLSKAERLLGVSDTGVPAPSSGMPEWRPRQSKLRNMGSNLSLLTDIKKAISGANPRSASRIGRNAPPLFPGRPAAPAARALDGDQHSVVSDVGDYGKPPLSAGAMPGYNYKDTPAFSNVPEQTSVAAPPSQDKLKMLKYSEEDQEKIMANLRMNGMMSEKDKRRSKRPHTAKGHDDRTTQKHSRGNSGASKVSATASSKYSRDESGQRYSQSRKGSASSAAQPDEETPRRTSGLKTSQVLTPRIETQAPGIRISRIESPEGERIQKWLTYTDMSSETSNTRADWLAPKNSRTVKESQSSTSVHTMTSLETGTLFPIQGGPDDWSTVRRHSRQSSMLVNSAATGEHAKSAPVKGGKVYYTDLQQESVLALSSSDSESDAESENSALARKRLSVASNGNDTQPTAWSSTASSRSQSRKMSLNTHATSPQRFSFSSDQWNYPIPNPQIANLSREPSGASTGSPRQPRQPNVQVRQPSPMRQEIEESDLLEYPPGLEEDLTSPTDQGPPSSPTLSPIAETGPQLGRITTIADEETPNPLVQAIRAESLARKNTASSANTTDAHADPRPAPTRPLPMPPTQIQTPTISTPTAQTPSADDDSSVFSFPKPPRVLNRAGSRSTDMLSSPSDSIGPSFPQNCTPESNGSDGSGDTIKPPSMRRRPSNLSVAAPDDTPSGGVSPQSSRGDLLAPEAAYRGVPYVIEEFSPIVFAFPEHVRQQMQDGARGEIPFPEHIQQQTDDNNGSENHMASPEHMDPPSKHRSYSESDVAGAIMIPSSSQSEFPQAYEDDAGPLTDPIPATIYELEEPESQPHAASSSPYIHSGSFEFPRAPRTAPLPINTSMGLSPVSERPGSPSAVRTAPPSVQTHWEKALATRFPAVPLPQVPPRPLRRFHLPTTSTGSTVTSRSAQSPKPGHRERDGGFGSISETRVSVGPGSNGSPNAGNFGANVGIARSGSDASWGVRPGRASPATSGHGNGAGSGERVGQSMNARMSEMASSRNSPSPGPGGRTMRTSKRISTGKGIEPLRLSRIGNAV